jgi:hypothetical protein
MLEGQLPEFGMSGTQEPPTSKDCHVPLSHWKVVLQPMSNWMSPYSQVTPSSAHVAPRTGALTGHTGLQGPGASLPG